MISLVNNLQNAQFHIIQPPTYLLTLAESLTFHSLTNPFRFFVCHVHIKTKKNKDFCHNLRRGPNNTTTKDHIKQEAITEPTGIQKSPQHGRHGKDFIFTSMIYH